MCQGRKIERGREEEWGPATHSVPTEAPGPLPRHPLRGGGPSPEHGDLPPAPRPDLVQHPPAQQGPHHPLLLPGPCVNREQHFYLGQFFLPSFSPPCARLLKKQKNKTEKPTKLQTQALSLSLSAAVFWTKGGRWEWVGGREGRAGATLSQRYSSQRGPGGPWARPRFCSLVSLQIRARRLL